MPSIFHAIATQEYPDCFLYSIIAGFVEKNGIQILSVSGLQNCDAELISEILSHLQLSNDLISVVCKLLPNQEYLFWNKIIIPSIIWIDNLDINYVIDRLLEVDRPIAAVNACGNIHEELPVPTEKLFTILYKAAKTESTEKLDPNAVHSIIKILQDEKEPNIQDLSEIEFIYLPWLDEFSPVSTRALICRLANDADFFCELLQMYYKKHHDDASIETTPKISPAWSERLFQIFFKFQAVPGTDWNGVFHEDIFIAWMQKVKDWARENDRYEVAMLKIGNGISYAPVGNDGLLCEKALREVLNASENDKVRSGYALGIYNQRGAHIIDPEGKAERALAQKYNLAAEKAEEYGYSRYSELLREIANNYISEAEYNAFNESRNESDD